MRIPPDPQKGELIRDDFMALKRFAVASRIVGVEGGRVQETPNGTTIRIDSEIRNRPRPPILPFQVYELGETDGTWTAKVKEGLVTTFDPIGFAAPTLFKPTNVDTEIEVSESDTLYCKVTTDKNDVVTAAEIIAAPSVTDTHAQPDPGGTVGTYHYKLADFELVDDVLKVKTTYHVGGNIIHRPGRNNRNLKITIQQRRVVYNACPPGVSLETVSSDEYIYYRKGLYVGVTDPGLESGETETERIVTRLHA